MLPMFICRTAVVSRDEYLGGLMDAIGELNRYAVLRATARDMVAVHHARDTVDVVHHQLMLFDWRNGNLRRKYDALKYTLKKLEQIIYELTLASSTGFAPASGGLDEAGGVAGGEWGDDVCEGEGDNAGGNGAGSGGWRGGGRGGGGGGRAAKRPRAGEVSAGPTGDS